MRWSYSHSMFEFFSLNHGLKWTQQIVLFPMYWCSWPSWLGTASSTQRPGACLTKVPVTFFRAQKVVLCLPLLLSRKKFNNLKMLKRNYQLTKQNWLVYGLRTVLPFNRFWFWKKSFRAFRERVPRVWISLKHQNYFRVICNCYQNCGDHIFILYTVSAWVVGRAIRLFRNTVELINILFLVTASGYLKIMRDELPSW